MFETAALVLFLSTATPQPSVEAPVVHTQTVQVVDKARPFWKKLFRGTARVATLGAVQAATETIKQNTPFHLAFNHDGIDTDGYTIYLNTAVSATKSITDLVNGTVTHFYSTGLTKGSYTFIVRAFGEGGSSADSLPLTASVTAGNPSAPGQVRIIK